MITEIKRSKRLSRNHKKHYKKFKHARYINDRKNKKTKKNVSNNNVQKGGAVEENGKEKFEVRAMEDMNYSALNLGKYANANIDWGIMPGAPPMDCVIL
jgi:hypothetical protein